MFLVANVGRKKIRKVLRKSYKQKKKKFDNG